MKKRFLHRHAATCALPMLMGLVAATSPAQAAVVDSIEFYNRITTRYFRTELPAEAAYVDSLASLGWARTGQSYKVWPTAADAPAGAKPLCRFYSPVFNTHFFTIAEDECELIKHNPFWSFEGTLSYALPPVNGKCSAGTQPIYRNYAGFTVNHRFTNTLPLYQDMVDKTWIPEGVQLCVPGVSTADLSDAYRLLKQTTFGPTEALAAHVQSIGVEAWLNEQFSAAPSSYPTLPFVPFVSPSNCSADNSKPASDPVNICARDSYSLFQVQLAFMQNALNKPDQLRQRVAFALSQILVTSGAEINHAYGMSRYQQLVLDHAFGNYQDLLTAVTLSPAMGRYLDMANSNKPAPGVSANENYARELMQLFTIGLYQLNMDGTQKRDAKGNLMPSYTQTTVENLARALTGYTYASFGGGAATRNNPVYYEFPMVPVESNHDTGSKTLLNGYVIPAGQTAAKDVSDVINHLFNHPNTAPFISKQLIQKLVTGDPTPAYVARVAAIFNDNGQGVRGDLKAVVRAILTDSEARGEIKTESGYGHLKEPALFAIGMMRGLGGASDGVAIMRTLSGMGQNLFNSPTVFNYYSPDTQISNGLLGPEFGIFNATTTFARQNFLNTYVMGNPIAPDTTVQGAIGTTIDWAPWQALAGNPTALVDKLNWVFTHGALSATAQQIIVDAVNAVPASNTLSRAKTAAYLVLGANPTQVER
ncbi:MAG: DUF1800 domain-containing protein [Betaproteobacteria bacterium]|nr:DUF1800 domain-containing protein [Betaproteobacteria bacterium]